LERLLGCKRKERDPWRRHRVSLTSPVIRSIEVVDIKDLTPEVRSKVEDVVAKASEDDLRQLRDSIDASPEAVSALKAKGLSSAQVVAVTLTTNGVLTLFAKTV
jgi:hypothetical protein